MTLFSVKHTVDTQERPNRVFDWKTGWWHFLATGRMLQLFGPPYVQNQSVTSLSQSKTHSAEGRTSKHSGHYYMSGVSHVGVINWACMVFYRTVTVQKLCPNYIWGKQAQLLSSTQTGFERTSVGHGDFVLPVCRTGSGRAWYLMLRVPVVCRGEFFQKFPAAYCRPCACRQSQGWLTGLLEAAIWVSSVRTTPPVTPRAFVSYHVDLWGEECSTVSLDGEPSGLVVGRCGGSWPCIGSRCGEALAGTAYCPCATWCWLGCMSLPVSHCVDWGKPSGACVYCEWAAMQASSLYCEWAAMQASSRCVCHRYMAVSLPPMLIGIYERPTTLSVQCVHLS